jgi:hypothetical protein
MLYAVNNYRWSHDDRDVFHTYNRTPREPEKLQEESFYVQGIQQHTYQYWTAQRDFQAKKQANAKDRKSWEKSLEQTNKGIDEKKEAISKVIMELEQAEKALIEAGAKTFAEMYPHIAPCEEQTAPRYPYPEPEPYKTNMSFCIPDLNDATKDGYMRLFEAAWSNDLEMVKKLTLTPWKSDMKIDEMTPLRVATQDSNGFSPFSIAVLRGHRELARKIIEICAIQYHKEDNPTFKKRWDTIPNDSDDESDDCEGKFLLTLYPVNANTP